MKKRFLILTAISLFALSGCDFLDKFLPGSNNQQNQQKEEQNSQNSYEYQGLPSHKADLKTEEVTVEEKMTYKKVGEFYGCLVKNEKYSGYEFSKSNEEINRPSEGIGEIKIYGFNDFHGAVLNNYPESGLIKIGSFFKEKSVQENTLILDQGDTWQGSFESNFGYGEIVQDVFNYAGVSLRTVGNHDFDWGLEHLKSTNNRKMEDDYIPCLAANVYDYANGKNGNIQQSAIGNEYATFVLDNGVKVGVVGVIGTNQITSICASNVEKICFTNHTDKIKELSDYLRTKKNCDIIIASAHEGSEDLLNLGLSDISPVSKEKYCDLVLGGHVHSAHEQTENGTKFVQWDSNGSSIGLVSLKYNFSSNSIISNETQVNTYHESNLNSHNNDIEKMVNDYVAQTDEIGNEVVHDKFSGKFDSGVLGRLMSEAIFDRVSENAEIDFAICNPARTSFDNDNGTYTVRDLYKTFPFDNEIILMTVSSLYSIRNIIWSSAYREDTSLEPQEGSNYRIAVVDYVALHENFNREKDKFPDARNVEVFADKRGKVLTYKDILYDYLKKNANKTFAANDYKEENQHFVRSSNF